MKQRSLKTKLLLLTMGLFIASGLAMTLMQSSSLNSLRNDIVSQTRQALEQEVSRTLQFQAERYAVQIAALLQQSYQVPLGMAAQLEGSMAQPDGLLSRPQVEMLLRSRLQQAGGISSIYAQFEPDGYDGQDASWMAGASHSVASKGSLEIYFTRDQGDKSASSRWMPPAVPPNTTPRSTSSAFATASGTCAAATPCAPA